MRNTTAPMARSRFSTCCQRARLLQLAENETVAQDLRRDARPYGVDQGRSCRTTKAALGPGDGPARQAGSAGCRRWSSATGAHGRRQRRKGAALTLLVRAPSMQVLIPNGSDGYRSRQPGHQARSMVLGSLHRRVQRGDDQPVLGGRREQQRLAIGGAVRMSYGCRPSWNGDFYDKPLALAYDAGWYYPTMIK